MNIKLKKIESEKEYWDKHKEYKKKLNKFMRKGFKYMFRQDEFINGYEKILLEMEFIGLVKHEWVINQLNRLIEELKVPNEFKEFVERGKEKLKNKIKKKNKNNDEYKKLL